jgi:hypothetical protein
MKILIIICNFVLFESACIGLLTKENSNVPFNPVYIFLLLVVPILDNMYYLNKTK